MTSINKTFLNKLKTNPGKLLPELSINDIVSLIQKANYEYYNTNTPIMSDSLYDIVKEFLEKKVPDHPILKSIGAHVSEDSKKVTLPYFLGSLDKIKNDDKSLMKWISSHQGEYVISDKLDGVSALICVDGTYMNMFTRGNGTIGQDISHLLPFIKNIPSTEMMSNGSKYAVRGELIISKIDFEEHISDKSANARNTVSGIVNAKLPDLNITRHIQFVAYELVDPVIIPNKQIAFITMNGFTVVHHTLSNNITTNKLCDIVHKRRIESEFDIDGIVVTHNVLYNRESNTNPTYAFAFKSVHSMHSGEVVVKNVEWNISKDGYFKPVITFDEINLAGVMIKRATGINAKFIVDNKIGPGSRVLIIRSGDVIPNITKILSPSETGEPQLPDTNFIWNTTRVDIVVDNVNGANHDNNKEIIFKNLEYFFKKMNARGISTGILRKLFDNGYDSISKILNLSNDDLLGVSGFKDKMIANVIESLTEVQKTFTLIALMDASNIFGRGIGTKKIELILDSIGDKFIKSRSIPSLDSLLAIKGIEKTTASQFMNALPKFFQFIDEHKLQCYINDKEVSLKKHTNYGLFKGQNIVFTGFRDIVLKSFIETNGGEVLDTITKKSTLLIKKDSDEQSSKLTKAKELGVNIVLLSEFKQKYDI